MRERMKGAKRIAAGIMTATLAGGLLAGCGKQSAPETKMTGAAQAAQTTAQVTTAAPTTAATTKPQVKHVSVSESAPEKEGATGTKKKVTFAEVKDDLIKDFNGEQDKFLNMTYRGDYRGEANVYDKNGLVSVFAWGGCLVQNEEACYAYGVNIDTDEQRIVQDEELLKKYGVDTDRFYKTVATDCLNHIHIEKLIKGEEVNDEMIEVSEIRANIDSYATMLKEGKDVIYVYTDGEHLYAAYFVGAVIGQMKLSSHMGIGLEVEPVTVKII